MRATCGIPTKNRYDTLVLTLQGLAFQTTKDFDIIIVDDSDEPKDLRDLREYQCVFDLFNRYGINWRVIYGKKLGQHHSHQIVQDEAKTEWIWRIDDDEIPEPDVLERLLYQGTDAIGAVGGLVPQSVYLSALPTDLRWNPIDDLSIPNIQWFWHPDGQVKNVEHLNSSFVYRKGKARYELGLSPAAHREETIFTHEILRTGYKLLVEPRAVTWHFRNGHGGIRSHSDARFWMHDEHIFSQRLKEWGVNGKAVKPIVLDCGRGDHILVRSLLPEIKKKYPKIVLATCYPDIFEGEEQISIAEANMRFGNLDRFNVYKFCIDTGWQGELRDAYRRMLGL